MNRSLKVVSNRKKKIFENENAIEKLIKNYNRFMIGFLLIFVMFFAGLSTLFGYHYFNYNDNNNLDLTKSDTTILFAIFLVFDLIMVIAVLILAKYQKYSSLIGRFEKKYGYHEKVFSQVEASLQKKEVYQLYINNYLTEDYLVNLIALRFAKVDEIVAMKLTTYRNYVRVKVLTDKGEIVDYLLYRSMKNSFSEFILRANPFIANTKLNLKKNKDSLIQEYNKKKSQI